jgi:DeoR/GlpR family transcriptional regulator of sugar metabolism
MSSAVAKAQRHLELERLIRKRLSLAQIASQLRVSLKTVKRDLATRRENMLCWRR